MEASGGQPKIKIHKPGFTRYSISDNNALEGSKYYVLGKRESTAEIGLDKSLPFRRESITSRTKSTEFMSYNLWKSRRSSLPSYLPAGQKKDSSCSGLFVPSVLMKEPKVLRKYSTSLGSTKNTERNEQMKEVNPGTDAAKSVFGDAVTRRIQVLPKEETWEQIFRRESSAITQGTRSYYDSVSTMRGSTTSLRNGGGRPIAYYAKSDSIKRWLSEVE
ncbi:hypothetical protein AWC38_SpisGene18094 [Stylophora pistillata]|uniref:Uncharacterized protein n=1 Tax=Stylophora pistillata TaxID=50429 RepID=A0A2B4RIY6_STYPI|nr:hypothetical protein AWC38_SpisGene18094 [Stylophora pistillata]